MLTLAESFFVYFCTLLFFALAVNAFINKPDPVPWGMMFALVVMWLLAMLAAFLIIMRLNQTFFAWLFSDQTVSAASPTTTRATATNQEEQEEDEECPAVRRQ